MWSGATNEYIQYLTQCDPNLGAVIYTINSLLKLATVRDSTFVVSWIF